MLNLLLCLGFASILVMNLAIAAPSALLDDSVNRISSVQQGILKRRELIRRVWGEERLPTVHPARITESVIDPRLFSEKLERVDRWTVEIGQAGVSHNLVFRPARPNGRLIIYHQGHSETLAQNGGDQTIRYFADLGYTVVGMLMPSYGQNTNPGRPGFFHDDLFQAGIEPWIQPMRYFLEPVLAVVNQATKEGGFSQIDMTGISGGGWTTTVYAALDPRVRHSFPVAGSIPLYLRLKSNDVGDREQYDREFYSIAGYPELYTMAALESGRVSVQILNPLDSCCFAVQAKPAYDGTIRNLLGGFGNAGRFEVRILRGFPGHAIDREALEEVMRPVLEVNGN